MLFISDCGFEVPDKFVVGYAIDYNEYFRDLDVSFFLYPFKYLFIHSYYNVMHNNLSEY